MILTTYNFDLLNAFFALSALFMVSWKLKLNGPITFILFCHLIVSFLTNYFLFSPDYMPDQWNYLSLATEIRETFLKTFTPPIGYADTATTAGFIFAFFPLPLVQSVYSISIINFLIFLLLFYILIHQRILSYKTCYFYLLYPSFMLYHAVALRDIIVVFFMVLSMLFLLKKSYFLTIVFTLPLVLLKIQNLLAMLTGVAIYFFYTVFFPRRSILKLSTWQIILFFAGFYGIYYIFKKYISLAIVNNVARYFFVVEEGNLNSDYIPYTSWGEVFVRIAIGIPYFLIMPFPWEAENVFQLIQSVENIVLTGIVLFLILKNIKTRVLTSNMIYLYITFFAGLGVYTMFVKNFGTAARYRFPFLLVFIIFMSFEISRTRVVPLKKLRIVPQKI